MKFVSIFLRVLAVLVAVATLVAFFFPFVNVELAGKTADLNGMEVAFSGDLSAEIGAEGIGNATGGYYIGAVILLGLTALSLVLGLVTKKKGWNGFGLVTGILGAILMVVFLCNEPAAYVDMGSITSATLAYTLYMKLAVIGSIATVVVTTIAILVKDALDCKQTGALTIPKRIVKFLREYKSELKKVVWPGPRSVIKNTCVVLLVCGFALLIIWLADLGLYELFKLCFGSKA